MMKQITVVVQNRVGALADVTEVLSRSGINIISISAQGFENNGVIRVLTTDMNTALHDLSKAGFNAMVNDIIVLKLPDKPGELYKITKKLSKEGLNLRAVYIIGKENDRTVVAIDPEDYQRAVKALEK
ncbi:MAG: ACT domain-containing protein [Candidatus Micrarchaeota archaeon]|nr:ACT domain-containing protein [Candidatus Micrarchaeota archaeon]